MTELLGRVEDCLPFRHNLADNERLEAGDQRGQSLTGVKANLVLSRDPGELLMLRPVTMARRIDRHHSETTLGHETARKIHDARGLLVLSAAVPHHDQGAGPVSTSWSP
jgi:hypothetical protein